MSDGSPVVELRNVSKVYTLGSVEVRALDHVSLKVMPGEFISVVGPSGSGKSTLLSVIGCLAKPTSGRVLIDGVDVTELSEAELSDIRCLKIGFIFQFFNLIPTLTALENVELPMIFAGKLSEWEMRDRALELLDLVGLVDRANHRPSELSGGQQQRVAIARALANDPALVLADEPTGNLDSKTGSEVISLMEELNRETGKTFIIVTHDTNVAKRTRKMLYMVDGRLYEDPSKIPTFGELRSVEDKAKLLAELEEEVEELSSQLRMIKGKKMKVKELRDAVLRVRMGVRRVRRRLDEI
ncbi:MAG: macrolide ABC transporter ATP-binding protein [Thermoproteota archaeon]|nr:MAG: macrolide ABC transporter ATP-binding protein [Candidatus Korarchaeota archaeon]